MGEHRLARIDPGYGNVLPQVWDTSNSPDNAAGNSALFNILFLRAEIGPESGKGGGGEC